MERLRGALTDAAGYRRLLFLLSALLLGQVWFVALVTGWSLCLGFAITPLLIPLLIGMAAMTRVFASVEAAVVRALLGVHLRTPSGPRWDHGVWAYFRAMLGASFWRAQGYLLLRWFPGVPIAALLVGLLAAALGMVFAPAWIPFVHGGAQLGFWRPHTLPPSLALVPVGLLLLPPVPPP